MKKVNLNKVTELINNQVSNSLKEVMTIFILITMDLQCSYCLFMALLYSYSLAGITHIQLLASSGLIVTAALVM